MIFLYVWMVWGVELVHIVRVGCGIKKARGFTCPEMCPLFRLL